MRELKFRVWDKHDERMKYAEMEWFDDMFAFRFDHRGFEEEDNSDVVIMQYTGLKDKNGKDIYEGDIFCNRDFQYIVNWESGAFYLKHTDKQLNNWGLLSDLINHKEMYKDIYEVTNLTGNIHENPDLILPDQ